MLFRSIGAAYLSWINQRLKRNSYNPRENIYDWFYAETLIGDPLQSALLTPEYPVKIKAKNIPAIFNYSLKAWDAAGRLKNKHSKKNKIWSRKQEYQ